LSSRYMMLNRGVNSLIQVYSSWMASCSEATTVHSTAAAVCTMVRVFGGKVLGLTKYELRRERRLLALPTEMIRPWGSLKRYTPGSVGMSECLVRYEAGSAKVCWSS